jgi:26S proteasome regulatory subunit N8
MAASAAASGSGSSDRPAAAAGAPDGFSKVVVHPLVMLSVTDHFHRVAKSTKKRVVGMLLGSSFKGRVDIVNSFAVPFAEDPKDPKVFFLDHFYLEKMYALFRKVDSESASC